MEKMKPLTENDILQDNLRICRIICNFQPREGLLDECRNALRDNIKQYDKLQLKKQEKARERKARKSGGVILIRPGRVDREAA